MQPEVLNLASSVTGYALFLFVRLSANDVDDGLIAGIERLGQRMDNAHDDEGGPSPEAFQSGRFQFLRTEPRSSRPRDLPHDGVMLADGLVRLEAATLDPISTFEVGLRRLIESKGGSVETLRGVQRPRSYTSHAMTKYAYDRALAPGSASVYPLAVVTPMNKTDEWWNMDWMRRESLFLPRFDDKGNILIKGHALATDAGVTTIVRRLVHAPDGYGTDADYDFVGYFEFAEEHAETFREVMAGLRDRVQNPEWNYVRERPEWWGRRVRKPEEIWDARP